MQENLNPAKLIKEWRKYPNKHKRDDRGMYSLASLLGSFSEVPTMMCHIFGLANTQKFSEEWVPLIDATSDNYIMDWRAILSNNLSMQIRNYRQKHMY